MSFLILFFLQIAFSDSNQNLSIQNMNIETLVETPSCLLLKHRDLEREKVIRELKHIYKMTSDDPIAYLMESNQLVHNKLFMDKELWSAPVVKIGFHSSVSKKLADAIVQYGINQILFSIKGEGVTWTSYPHQTPNDIQFNYDQEKQLLAVEYHVYMSVLCVSDPVPLQLRWFYPGEEPVGVGNTYEDHLLLNNLLLLN